MAPIDIQTRMPLILLRYCAHVNAVSASHARYKSVIDAATSIFLAHVVTIGPKLDACDALPSLMLDLICRPAL